MYSTKLGDKSVLVVTSPQHMLREILTLKKSDFTDVGGLPTFESPIDPKSLVRKNINNIDVPENLALRYNMWSYLICEIKVAREFTALLNNRLMGWI